MANNIKITELMFTICFASFNQAATAPSALINLFAFDMASTSNVYMFVFLFLL